MSTPAPRSARRACSAPLSVVYTSFSPPVCQKLAAGSSPPDPLTVTLSGYSDFPAASRAARRSGELTSSRGLSARMVPAPMRIASLDARTSSTRSKSAGPESSSRSGPVSSR